MSWYDFGGGKPLGELREEALAILADPPAHLGALRPVAAEGRKPASTALGAAFAEAAAAWGRSASRVSKARGYLRNHCLIDLRVKEADAGARAARGGGGADALVHGGDTYGAVFRLKPPPARWWDALVREAAAAPPADAAALAAGRLPPALEERLADPDCPLLPRARGVATSCECLDGESACKHVLCAMLGLAVLIDREPLLLLRVHGLDPARLLPDLTGTLPPEDAAPVDALDAATAARLFGL